MKQIAQAARTQAPGNGSHMAHPEQPAEREIVRSFGSFEQVQHAIEDLARAHFPTQQVMIVAQGVRSLERSGRSGRTWAAVHGFLLGAPIGVVLALVVALFAWAEGLAAALTFAAWGALAGGVAGVGIGVGTELLRSPRREGAEAVMDADRYDLMADGRIADSARYLLDRLERL